MTNCRSPHPCIVDGACLSFNVGKEKFCLIVNNLTSPFYIHFKSIQTLVVTMVQSTHPCLGLKNQLSNSNFTHLEITI